MGEREKSERYAEGERPRDQQRKCESNALCDMRTDGRHAA